MTKRIEDSLLKAILQSPQAPMLLEELKTALQKEKEKRLDFYKDITEQQKAEFINGEIIIHSPVMKRHNEVSGQLYSLINYFVHQKDLGFVGIEKILIQLTRNDYEPDICFFLKAKAKRFKSDQSLFPVPDFVVEVLSKSTEKRDRGVKFIDYAAHGIKEYWIIDPAGKTIEQYLLKNKEYDLAIKANTGEISSKVIKGFTIPVQAIFDKKTNFATLKNMMNS